MTAPTDLFHAIAQDLTALQDPDLILTGLVRRVRVALGTDLAYVSLNDAEGRETHIQFSDGVRTPGYAAIAMPIGTGVLGMAAAGVIAESPDYLPDLAKLHIADVDVAVNGEGVRAILGIPLRAGGEVVGALTVANRTPGSFTPDQRALLESAALIGSTAVEIYLLRRDIEQGRQELNLEVSRLRDLMSDTVAELRLARELVSVLVSGGGSADLMSTAAEALGGIVRFGDSGATADNAGRAVPLEGGGTIEFIGTDQEPTSDMVALVGAFVSTAALYENAIEDARHFQEIELVQRLVEPSTRTSGPALRTGLPGSGAYVVAVAEIDDPLVLRQAAARVRNALGSKALSAARHGHLIIIVRHGDDTLARAEEALSSSPYWGGVGTAETDADLSAACGESLMLATASRRLARRGRLHARTDLGVVAFAIGGTPEDAHRLIHSQLAPIISGTPRDVTLRDTALRYLDSQGSTGAVASQLHLHENTVRQRLSRLDDMLPGWRNGPRSLDTHLALRAEVLLEPHTSAIA